MSDSVFTCGVDIRSIENKEFAHYETTKANEIAIALEKSGISYFAKCSESGISLTYDGSYKESVDEIIAKVMSGNYEEMLREIQNNNNPDNVLELLPEVAGILHTSVGTLESRPADVQELLCKTYVNLWLCDTPTIQRELDRILDISSLGSAAQEFEKSTSQEKFPKMNESENMKSTRDVILTEKQSREAYAAFSRERQRHLAEITRRRQQSEQEQIAQAEQSEREKK